MRALWRLLVLMSAAYGPYAPLMVVLAVVAPVLLVLSGWPWLLELGLVCLYAVLVVGAALWLGPQMRREIRRFMEGERR